MCKNYLYRISMVYLYTNFTRLCIYCAWQSSSTAFMFGYFQRVVGWSSICLRSVMQFGGVFSLSGALARARIVYTEISIFGVLEESFGGFFFGFFWFFCCWAGVRVLARTQISLVQQVYYPSLIIYSNLTPKCEISVLIARACECDQCTNCTSLTSAISVH